MKRLLIALIFCFSTCLINADVVLDLITPTTVTGTATIATPGANLRNCLTDLDVVVTSTMTLRILDGSTTTYALDLSTSNIQTGINIPPFIRSWPTDNPYCAGYNASLTVNINGPGTYKMNYRGQIRGNR